MKNKLIRLKHILSDWYYDLSWGIKNLLYYFKPVWRTRPWDFKSAPLELLTASLKNVRTSMVNGYEIRESADLKIKDIDRCLKIISNLKEDDYVEKVGGFCFTFKNRSMDDLFIPIGNGMFKMRDDRTDEEHASDSEQLQKAIDLEESEWAELWNIIANGKEHSSGAQSWWD